MASGEINEALSAINAFGLSLRNSTKQYSAFIDKMENHNDTASDRRELRAQENGIKVLKKTSDALGDLQDKSDKLKKENEMQTKNSKKTSKELKKLARDLHKASPQTFTKEMVKSFDNAGNDAASVRSAFNVLNAEITKSTKVTNSRMQTDVKAMKQTYQATQALKDRTAALKSSVKGLFTFERGMTAITASLKRSFDQLEYAQQKQIGMYSIIGEGIKSSALKMGLAPEEMQKFVGENKNLFLSMQEDYTSVNDAVRQNVSMLTAERDGRESLMDMTYKLTGSYAGASQLMGTSMDILKGFGEKVGLNDIADQSEIMINQFAKLGRMSNKTTSEVASMTQKMLGSEAVRNKMLKMQTVQERKAYKDSILKEAERNKKLGISLESTFAMAEKAAGLSDRGVMDRMKESMVVAMVAAQSGMSGKDADRLRQLDMMVGKDGDQQKEYNTLLGQMNSRIADIRGKNDPASLAQAAALEHLIAKMPKVNEFAQTIAKETEFGAGKGTKDPGEDTLQTIPKFLQEIKQLWDSYARPLIADPVVSAIGGLVGVLTDLLGPILTSVGGIWGALKMFKGGQGLASGIASKVAGLANGAKSRVGGMVTAAKNAGGGLVQKAAELASKAMQSVKSIGSQVVQHGKNLVPSLWGVLKNFAKSLFRRLPIAIAAAIGLKLGDIAGPKVRQGIEAIDKKLGTDAWGSVVDTVGKSVHDTVGLVDRVANFISGGDAATPVAAGVGPVIADGSAVTNQQVQQAPANQTVTQLTELNAKISEQNAMMLKQIEAAMEASLGITKMNKTIEDTSFKQQESLDEQNDLLNENSQFGEVQQKVK